MAKKLWIIASVFVFVAALNTKAYADTLTLNSPDVVGAIGTTSQQPPNSNITTETTISQTLLDQPAGTSAPPSCTLAEYCYQTSNTEYSGTLTFAEKVTFTGDSSQLIIPDGLDYVLVKYDGPNAGYVLFYVGAGSTTTAVPEYSYNIWGKNDQQYQISHWTGFCSTADCNIQFDTPDGGSTVTLLGSALLALGVLARKTRRT
jgi:hypothetical protein